MIPRDYITEWRARAPWVQDSQVEQDLVISRALVEIFSHPVLADGLAFRGGTGGSLIPRDYITEWRARAPWVQDSQVEQDLVISRALVEIFSHPVLADGSSRSAAALRFTSSI